MGAVQHDGLFTNTNVFEKPQIGTLKHNLKRGPSEGQSVLWTVDHISLNIVQCLGRLLKNHRLFIACGLLATMTTVAWNGREKYS